MPSTFKEDYMKVEAERAEMIKEFGMVFYPSMIDLVCAEKIQKPYLVDEYFVGRTLGADEVIVPCKSCIPPWPRTTRKTNVTIHQGLTRSQYDQLIDTCCEHYKYDWELEEIKNAAKQKKTVKSVKRKSNESHVQEPPKKRGRPAKKVNVENNLPKKKERKPLVIKKEKLCPSCHLKTSGGCVLCRGCTNWYHLKCVGIKSYKLAPQDYICASCTEMPKKPIMEIMRNLY